MRKRKVRRWRIVIPCYACGRADYRSPSLDCSEWCDCGVAGRYTENGTWIEEVRSVDRMVELFGPMTDPAHLREDLARRFLDHERGFQREFGLALQGHLLDAFKLSPEARELIGEILEREGYRPTYIAPLPVPEAPEPEFRYHVPFMRYGNPSARAVTILLPLDEIDESPTTERPAVISVGGLARTTPAMSEPSNLATLPRDREPPATE